jgi:4'-phosphopantetheinyl transferase EntD
LAQAQRRCIWHLGTVPNQRDQVFYGIPPRPGPIAIEPGAPDLGDALRGLAPASVTTGWRAIDPNDWLHLHPVERELVAGAVPKRRAEFASGRMLVHDLLEDDRPVTAEPNRMPRWPAPARGSLAHDDRWVVAAITRDPRVAALGIDIEPLTPLSADVAAAILRPEERSIDAHLAFVLKEAAYKAWSALGGGMLDHHDVLVRVDGPRFRAWVLEGRTAVDGRFRVTGDRAVALVVVSADAGARA